MHWKQPITTECLEFDTVTRLVFFEIMMHLRNKDMPVANTIIHGNNHHHVLLKRGQCIFNIERFSRESSLKKTRIKASVKILENLKNNENFNISLDFTRKSYGLIVTALNYDELVKFEHHSEIHGYFTDTSRQHHVNRQ